MYYSHAVTRHYGAMHVAEIVRKYDTKSGPSESRSYLLRRSYREARKVRHETLANLSALPLLAIEALHDVLSGKTLLVAGGFTWRAPACAVLPVGWRMASGEPREGVFQKSLDTNCH